MRAEERKFQSKFNLLQKEKEAICISSSRPASHACHCIKSWIAAAKDA